jgi:hypothetical protein
MCTTDMFRKGFWAILKDDAAAADKIILAVSMEGEVEKAREQADNDEHGLAGFIRTTRRDDKLSEFGLGSIPMSADTQLFGRKLTTLVYILKSYSPGQSSSRAPPCVTRCSTCSSSNIDS